jgi:hypothetical protein
MFQRRYDDPNKVRPVSRKVNKQALVKPKPNQVVAQAQPINNNNDNNSKNASNGTRQIPKAVVVEDLFEDLIFYFHEQPDNIDDWTETIEASGGFVSTTLTKKVTHVVVEGNLDDEEYKGDVQLVTFGFLEQSLEKGLKVKESDFHPQNGGKIKPVKRKNQGNKSYFS